MPLKVSLAPGESILVGKAKVTNGGQGRSTLLLHGDERILRQKYVMQASEADTPAKRFYCAVLLAYVAGLGGEVTGGLARSTAELMAADPAAAETAQEATMLILAGKDYEAVVKAHSLLERGPAR